uniref:glycosyltransferase family 4 protein n=1 Tax=Thaumasiovibrio occultus TaxID=1891184 RepID=UPI000B35C598|nr:glycosyltransferase family 4 protein [Thaumasiovibrio occultus]
MTTQKVILHINMASGFGGGEVQTLNLISHISNYQQYCLAKSGKAFQMRCQQACSAVTQLNLKQAFVLAWKHKKQLIIHAHDGRAVHIASLLKRLFGCKVVITRRMDKAIKNSGFSRASYIDADRLVAVSHAVKGSLSFAGKPVVVIPDSYSDLPSSENEAIKLAQFDGKFVVSHIANLLPIKNHELTLALARLVEPLRQDVVFLLVGDGKERSRLETAAQGLTNVVFWGFTPFVKDILDRTDLLLLPSHSEGLGSIILEGYQHGIPVIAAKVGGVPDVVQDGKTGALITDGGAQDYLAALMRFLDQDAMIENCKTEIAAIADSYSPAAIAERYMGLYQDL